jgi:hypothetical protein
MARPHDIRSQDAGQDQQMATALIAALQEIDAKTALQSSLYALKSKPLILIQCLNMRNNGSMALSK